MPVEAMEILHRIVAADRAARERADSARRETDSFDERLSELSREIRVSAMDDARREVDEQRRQAHDRSSASLAELDDACARRMEAMRRHYAEVKDAGVERMFRMVVGLDD